MTKARCFSSGYDCDSLAMEPISAFCESFIPFFANRPASILEIRTKSTQVRQLLDFQPIDNCVVAMSFTPEAASKRWEHKVPTLSKRLQAMKKLQRAGWKIAVRFEPVIGEAGVERSMSGYSPKHSALLSADKLHSVSSESFVCRPSFTKIWSGCIRMKTSWHGIQFSMMVCCHWQQEAKRFSRRWKIGSSVTSIVRVITDALDGVLSRPTSHVIDNQSGRSYMSSEGKGIAIVTGASSGIGLACSEVFLAAGFEVIGLARDFSKTDLSIPISERHAWIYPAQTKSRESFRHY